MAVVFITAAIFCLLSIPGVQSQVVIPPAGKDGNPTEIPPGQTCNFCHGGSYEHSANGNVLIMIGEGTPDSLLANFSYELNKTYTLLFNPTVTSKRYGFQMSALDPANNNAGTFILTDPTHTALTSIPINYLSHHNASSFKNWTFQWTSPSTDVGDISFYYTFVQADSNNQNTNDTVYKGITTIHALNTGIKAIENFRNVSLGPNPIEGILHLSFEGIQAQTLTIDLFSIDGKLAKNLFAQKNPPVDFNQTTNLDDIPPGMYIVKVSTEQGSLSRKVVVN